MSEGALEWELYRADQRQREAETRTRYHVALGRVADEWNRLHEELGLIFATVLGGSDRLAAAVWYSAANDRPRRAMLQAAVIEAYPTGIREREDILWLLKQVDAASDGRNIAVHAPCIVSLAESDEVIPSDFYGDRNAARLTGKRILPQLDTYAAVATALRRFAVDLHRALEGKLAPVTWPDRPQIPKLPG